jgi:nucleoside-diphosphate-sugar epimerase
MAAVGPSRDGTPVGPEASPRPLTAYGRSKLAGEAVVAGWPDAAVIRAPAVYGPGDRDLLPFFRLARFGVLPVVGPPDRRLQLVHARDLAEAMLAAAGSDATGVYHVAEPRAYRWGELLDVMARVADRTGVRVRVPAAVVRGAAAVSEAIARRTGRPVIFDRDKAKELLAEWLCDTRAARRELGWEPRVALAEGLRETAGWYRAYGWL